MDRRVGRSKLREDTRTRKMNHNKENARVEEDEHGAQKISSLINNSWVKKKLETALQDKRVPDNFKDLLRNMSPTLYEQRFGGCEKSSRTLSPLDTNVLRSNDRKDHTTHMDQSSFSDGTPVRPRSPSPLRPKILNKKTFAPIQKVPSLGSESDNTPTFQKTPAIFLKPVKIPARKDPAADKENELSTDFSNADDSVDLRNPNMNLDSMTETPNAKKDTVDPSTDDVNYDINNPSSEPEISAHRPSDLFLGFAPPKPKKANPSPEKLVQNIDRPPEPSDKRTAKKARVPQKETHEAEDSGTEDQTVVREKRKKNDPGGFKVPAIPVVGRNKVPTVKQKTPTRTTEAKEKQTRYLMNWIIRLRNKMLIIEGDLLDFSKPVPEKYDQRWCTSKIVARAGPKIVSTKSTDYVLEGELMPTQNESTDISTPIFILHKFRYGFPDNWRLLVDHWIKIEKERKARELNATAIWNSTMAGNSSIYPIAGNFCNISGISMASNISHFRESCKPVASSSVLPTLVESPNVGNHSEINAGTLDKFVTNPLVLSAVDSSGLKQNTTVLPRDCSQDQIGAADEPPAPVSGSERRPRSRDVRVNRNSKFAKESVGESMQTEKQVSNPVNMSPETTQMETRVAERTMSIQDFSMLRAKNYTSISIVNKKKNYNCYFCDFCTPLFNNLKQHVKKNHLESNKSDKTTSEATTKPRKSFCNPRAKSDESLLDSVVKTNESARVCSESPKRQIDKSATRGQSNSAKRKEEIGDSDDKSVKEQRARGSTTRSQGRRPESKKTVTTQDLIHVGDEQRGPSTEAADSRSKSRRRIGSNRKSLNQGARSSSTRKETNAESLPVSDQHEDYTIEKQRPISKSRGKSKATVKKNLSVGNEISKSKITERDAAQLDFKNKTREKFDALKAVPDNHRDKINDKENIDVRDKGVKQTKQSSVKEKAGETRQEIQVGYWKDFIIQNKTATCRVCPGAKTIPKSSAFKHSQTLKHFKFKNSQAVEELPQDEKNTSRNVHGDTSISRYGRILKNNSLLDSDNWVDVATKRTSDKKQSVKKGSTKKATEAIKRSNSKQAAKKSGIKSSESKRVVVKNPFKNREKETSGENQEKTRVPLHELEANPKTLKQRKKNDEIIEKLNEDHEDDIFQKRNFVGNLLGNLDDSSGSEISVHSARTPIEKYMKNRILKGDLDNSPLVTAESPHSPVKRHKNRAYVHKKIAEKRAMDRQLKRKKLSSALVPEITQSAKQRKIDASCRIIETLSQMSQNEEDDTDTEDWFPADEESSMVGPQLSAQGSLLNSLLNSQLLK